jgi:hypothetical protein
MPSFTRWAIPVVAVVVLLGGGWALRAARQEESAPATGGMRGPVAVSAAAVEHGPIEQRRELDGTLEATSEIVVAPRWRSPRSLGPARFVSGALHARGGPGRDHGTSGPFDPR